MHWTGPAVEHLLAIYERIHRDSELYAQQVVDRLILRSEQLSDFPLAGRSVPEYQMEEIR